MTDRHFQMFRRTLQSKGCLKINELWLFKILASKAEVKIEAEVKPEVEIIIEV